MSNLPQINRLIVQRLRPLFQRRFVSTSKKNNETVTADVCKTNVKTKSQEQNWMSYGFEYKSKEDDRRAMHSIMFASISLCLVVGGYIWAYAPNYSLRDWSVREAYLEIRRREASGAPLVDPNLIPPEKIVLPTDEELDDTEIII
ncbi:hypothetical protein ABEB36_007084 [Hypothenemus hampei]|uniref:NADH dehydrogenase [ubiquinone] 1 beta subcomplex subunit 11, mitochondrial n=1 Tax=Hypothenemus hampei TaxID=57062 RepID=A0ABD1EWP9_HYPHA